MVFGISNGGAGAMIGMATVGTLDTGAPCSEHSFTWIAAGPTPGISSVPPPGKYAGEVSGSLSSPATGSLTLTGTGGSWATAGSLGTGACAISFDVAAPVVTPYDGGRAMRIADPGRRWSVDMVSLVDPSAPEAGVAGFLGLLHVAASGNCPAAIGVWAGERDGYVPSPSRKPPTLPALPGLPGTPSARFATPPNFGTGDSAFVVFTGGSVTQLELEARRTGVGGIWVQNSSGQYVSYIVGAPASVNGAFRSSFPNGIPANTPLTVTRAPRTSRTPGATFAAFEVPR